MRKLSVLLALLVLGTACGKHGRSIDDYYAFKPTKDIRVQVNLSYKLDLGGGPPVAIGQQGFLLNGFVYENGEQPIDIAYASGGDPVRDLPVSLAGSQLSFDAVLRIPAQVQPAASGYSLHFSLKEASAPLRLDTATTSTVANLDALKGGVLPGADPAANPVSLSLATTIAYDIAQQASLKDGSASSIGAYEQLLMVVSDQVKLIEGTVDPGAKPDLATFASAILAGAKLAVMQSPSLQASIVGILQPAVAALPASSTGVSVTASVTSLLQTFATAVKTALGSTSSGALQIFKPNTYDPSAIPDPATYIPSIFAPKSVAFTDTDLTTAIGGAVLITPPAEDSGIDQYHVYFGGETMATATIASVGTVAKGSALLQVLVPAGTAIPSGATRFWVFPMAKGKDFAVAASVVIVNASASTPVANPPAAPTAVATGGLGAVTLSWGAVAGASSYNIYWSTISPVSTASNKISGATSPYNHSNRTAGTTYYYVVTAVSQGLESPISGEVSATTPSVLSLSGALSLGNTLCSTVFNDIALVSGRIYVAGTSNCNFPTDAALGYDAAFLAQFDTSGALQWVRRIYGQTATSSATTGNRVAVSSDGHVYVGGGTDGNVVSHGASTGANDIWYALYDRSGNQTWIRQVGGAGATATLTGIATSDSGQSYAVGQTSAQLTGGPAQIGNKDAFLLKIDPANGAPIWIQTIGTANGGGSHETEGASVAVSHEGSQIYVGGQVNGDLTGSGQQYESVYVARFGATAGSPVWIKQTKDGNGPKHGFGSLQLNKAQTQVIFTGSTSIDFVNGSLGVDTLFMLAYDTSGGLQDSMQDTNFFHHSFVTHSIVLEDGSFVVTGRTDDAMNGAGSTIGSTDWFARKYLPNHTAVWTAELGVTGGYDTECNSIAADALGNVVTAGFSTGNLSTGSGAAPGNKTGYLRGLSAASGTVM